MNRYEHSVCLDVSKCNGCTTCIKHCPTEAIRIRDKHAVINADRCIDCGAASLRYHRANGAQVRTVFRMTERGLVQVTGLPQPCDAEKELLQNCSNSIRQTGRQT